MTKLTSAGLFLGQPPLPEGCAAMDILIDSDRPTLPLFGTHESPPPSIRGFRPTTRSRATTPVSRPETPRPSVQLPSGSSSRWGLDGSRDDTQKHVNFDVPKEKGTAWYAGFGAAKVLEHRWFAWIKPKLNWTFLQPVIRCSVAVSSQYKACIMG